MEAKRVIETDDGFRFVVNPDTLISQNKYFQSIFKYNHQSHVRINGVSGCTMKILLDYVSKRNLKIDGSNILDILEAADYLMLDDLLGEFHRVLPRIINLSNCIDIFNAASNINQQDIANLCYCYIQTHFEYAVDSADIGMISFEHLQRFLSDTDLNVDSEVFVWKTIIKWIEKFREDRIQYFPSLLMCVRLEECTEECIRNMLQHPFAVENKVFGSIIDRYITISQEASLKKQLIEVVKSLSPIEPIYLGRRLSSLFSVSYNSLWLNGTALNLSITSHDRTIFEIPGKKRLRPKFLQTCGHRIYGFTRDWELLYFDLLNCSWTELSSPWSLYARGAVVKFDSAIFAIWVESYSSYLNVAFFDPDHNKWKKGKTAYIFTMNMRITSLSAVVHDGLIYTFGVFYYFEQYFVSHRKIFGRAYDPYSRNWSEVSLPKMKSEYNQIASFSGIMLMIHLPGSFVDRFYPDEGAWRRFKPLPYFYEFPRLEIRDGTLLVFELAIDDIDDSRNAVYWDQELDQWRDGSSLLHTPLQLPIDDADVIRKYRLKLMEDRWEAVAKPKKQLKKE